jgi:hypothetical protein
MIPAVLPVVATAEDSAGGLPASEAVTTGEEFAHALVAVLQASEGGDPVVPPPPDESVGEQISTTAPTEPPIALIESNPPQNLPDAAAEPPPEVALDPATLAPTPGPVVPTPATVAPPLKATAEPRPKVAPTLARDRTASRAPAPTAELSAPEPVAVDAVSQPEPVTTAPPPSAAPPPAMPTEPQPSPIRAEPSIQAPILEAEPPQEARIETRIRVTGGQTARINVPMADGSTLRAEVSVDNGNVDVRLHGSLETGAMAVQEAQELRDGLTDQGLELREFEFLADSETPEDRDQSGDEEAPRPDFAPAEFDPNDEEARAVLASAIGGSLDSMRGAFVRRRM